MPDKVIGIINYLGPNGEIGETQDFTDVNEYLSGIEKAFDEYGINGWRYVTQTNDLDVNYKVYVLASGEFGKEPISRKAFHLQHPEYVLPPVTFGVVEDTPWGRMKVVRQQDFDKAFAQGATDFSNCYFEDVTFSGEAAEISFQNSILANGCQFDHAHFKGASFDGASIYCSIQDCDLSRSSFLHTTINGHIKRTDLSGCFFKDSHINKTSFADCILNRCIMYETALNSTYFVRCEAFGLQHMDTMRLTMGGATDREVENYIRQVTEALTPKAYEDLFCQIRAEISNGRFHIYDIEHSSTPLVGEGSVPQGLTPEAAAKQWLRGPTPVLDLRNVFRSYQFNILYRVNKEIDAWRTSVNEEDRVKHYGAAERFAKVAANAIIANVQAHGSNENQFFIDTARGMITGFILLVAIYAPPTARHIISVFELIVQCSAPESLPVPGAPQRTMIASLMEHINDRRIRNYVAPASSADIRTALNIFSSALSHLLKFVDAEIEQLICDQSPEFDAQRFIDQPTAIFLICPDENPTRHFLASLFVRSFTDELIELAETKYNETLPRKFLYFLDEFGNMPPIENATALFSAIRSRGGRVMCALQAYDQLRLNYTEHQAATIEKNCHVQMNSAVAPAADKDAKRISEMLGNETILTGSKSKTRGVTTTNTSLIGRPLMSPAQLVTMPIGTFVVQCVSQNPYKSYLPDYSEYLELATEFLHPAPIRKYTPVLVAAPRMITMNARGSRIEIQKGMFDVADEEW